MQFELFINFGGNCREALTHYASVFQTEVNNLMTYGQAPPDPAYPLAEADKDKIMYADIKIGGTAVMFMDMPTGEPLATGNNINPTISTADPEEAARIFNALKQGGQVHMELQKTFFSELYGMITDQFGIIWHILYNKPEV